MYGKTLADFPERFDEFLEEFSDVDPDELDAAFRAARGACTQFPTPGDVRKQMRQQVAAGDQFDAEKAWDLVQKICAKHWHPDIGLYASAPPIDGATEHALRQIGGYRRLNETPLDSLSFVRRDFIDAFKRHHETGGYLAPTRKEAAALLESLRKELPR